MSDEEQETRLFDEQHRQSHNLARERLLISCYYGRCDSLKLLLEFISNSIDYVHEYML